MAIKRKIEKIKERVTFTDGKFELVLIIDWDKRNWTIMSNRGESFVFRNTINSNAGMVIGNLISMASEYAFNRLKITESEVEAKINCEIPF